MLFKKAVSEAARVSLRIIVELKFAGKYATNTSGRPGGESVLCAPCVIPPGTGIAYALCLSISTLFPISRRIRLLSKELRSLKYGARAPRPHLSRPPISTLSPKSKRIFCLFRTPCRLEACGPRDFAFLLRLL